jgi:cytochrome c peroxidase
VGKALGAYQRLLRCGPSRFDAWAQGDAAALSESEKRGAALFLGKGNCVSCHSGPYLSDQQFHNVGLKGSTVSVAFSTLNDRGAAEGIPKLLADPTNTAGAYSDGNDGRLPTAVTDQMVGAFRTPILRCVDMRVSFMHAGQLRTLEEVVAFFSRGGDPSGYPGKSELVPLWLSTEEQADLVAFLRALRGPGPDAALMR